MCARRVTLDRSITWQLVFIAAPVFVATAFVLAALAGAQQPGILIFGGAPPHVELTPPQVSVVSGTIAARLEQARALAAAKNWDEAVDIYRDLAADDTNRCVALDDRRFVSLATDCNLQLAHLPEEGLAVYRRRVDPQAERLYRDGLANRDAQLLRQVVERYYCSSFGDKALDALAELALERGDYDAARRDWEQISPSLRDPTGKPLALALRDVDLNAHWPEVERKWSERKAAADWLCYPDTKLELARIRACLVLTSIRSGEFERAALELEAFRHWHATAEGKIAGQQGLYVVALEKLLASARDWKAVPTQGDWPTFARSQDRAATAAAVAPTLVATWGAPLKLLPPEFQQRSVILAANGLAIRNAHEPQRSLGCYPVVVVGRLLYADSVGMHAVDIVTGKPEVTADGVLYRNETATTEQQPNALPPMLGGGVAHGVPQLTLNVVDLLALARMGEYSTARADSARGSRHDRIVGIDLRREGLQALSISPESGEWSFDGTPVCDGARVFVAMRRRGATPQAFVASFDRYSGNQLWRAAIGSADTPAGGLGEEITHNLLTLVGDRLYFNTNIGLVAAVDANNGEVAWIAKYDRLVGKSLAPGTALPPHFARDPSPCLYRDGVVYVAPSDTPDIFALDAETGKRVWTNHECADATQLMGTADWRLVVGGSRLSTLDLRTGQVIWTWPESTTAGLRGMGRGLVAGGEIFWPTRNEIYAFDVAKGTRTRSPISLNAISDCGANLAAAQGRLVAAGYDRLQVFGPTATQPIFDP